MANYSSTYTGAQIDAAIGKAGTAVQGSTGSTDNALLRADGTGGGTVQSSTATLSDTGNLTIGGGTETTSQPVVDATQTWNASGTTFTGIKFNVTNTASASGSLLMDLQVGGVSRYSIAKDGAVRLMNIAAGNNTSNMRFGYRVSDGSTRFTSIAFYNQSTKNAEIVHDSSNGNIELRTTSFNILQDGNSAPLLSVSGAGITLMGGSLTEQRNSTNAQTFRLYNTYTDSSNYERGFMRWNSNVLEIGTERAGTGTVRNLSLITDGSPKITANSATASIGTANARGAIGLHARYLASGYSASCNALDSVALAFGKTSIRGQFTFGFSAYSGGISQECQTSIIGYAGATSSAEQTEIFMSNLYNVRAIIPESTTWLAEIDVLARSAGGTDNACFKRRCVIKRDGSNNTALVGAVETIGTDISSAGASGWAVEFTADDTNESLKMTVTGAASTNIRWLGVAKLIEVIYA